MNKMDDLLLCATEELARFLDNYLPRLAPLYWQTHVIDRLTPQQQRFVREHRINSVRQLDFAALLRLLYQNWYELVNEARLPSEDRTLVKELQNVRNRCAHPSANPMPAQDIYRDLDTLGRVLAMIGASGACLDSIESSKRAKLAEMTNSNVGRGPRTIRVVDSSHVPTQVPHSSVSGGRDMGKREAIDRMNRRCPTAHLTNQNTRFSNINATVDVWWLDVPLALVEAAGDKAIHLLLCDRRSGTLHHLEVPKSHFRENLSKFSLKKRKISLYLSVDRPRLFQDTHSHVRFERFLHC